MKNKYQILFYRYHDKLVLVKEFEKECEFRGYNVIDSTHIFLAYQPEGFSEASAIIAIYDVTKKKENILFELGGAGESIFDYNKNNGLVVFNWLEGIYVCPLNNFKESNVKLLLKGINLFNPYWIDSSNIGYTEWSNQTWVVKKYRIKR